jgi:antirestriction protein ArdC
VRAVNHGGNRAYYSPTIDIIQMPPREAVRSTEAYYGVRSHEAINATGHPARLNREHRQKILTERAQERQQMHFRGCQRGAEGRRLPGWPATVAALPPARQCRSDACA